MEDIQQDQVVETVETPVVEAPVQDKAPEVAEKPAVEAKSDKKVINSLQDLKNLSKPEKAPEVKEPVAEAKPTTPVAEEWKPFEKVKVYGKEVEVPAEYKGLVTKENEDKFKTLFAKALAVDEMSAKNKTYVENFDKLNTTHTTLNKAIARVEGYIKNDDFDSLLDTLKIPEEKLQMWMLQKLNMKELPPEQQAVYNKKSEYQKQLYEKDQELEYYRGQYAAQTQAQEQAQIQQGFNSLDSVLQRPDVLSVVQAFDQNAGKPGSFRDEVIQRAAYIEEKLGRSLSVEEAVNEMKKFVIMQAAPQSVAPQNKVVQPKANQNPTLPTLSGKATSPVAKQISSLDDLRKLKKQVIASENPYNN